MWTFFGCFGFEQPLDNEPIAGLRDCLKKLTGRLRRAQPEFLQQILRKIPLQATSSPVLGVSFWAPIAPEDPVSV